jgi:hypothetical protein
MIWIALILGSVSLGWLLGEGVLYENFRLAANGLPCYLSGLFLGFTIGLYCRERIRRRRTYASPTMAYIGKGLLFSAIAVAATATASPVAWPPIFLPIAAAVAAAGSSLWIGNLPSRL